MRPDQWDRVQELLDRVLEAPQDERIGLLRELCGDDLEVAAEVESLLGHQPGDFLQHRQLAALVAEAAVTPHPESIDRYRIVRVLGEGGMGVVYLAEQAAPVHRTVAVKLIKLGMDTHQVVARFDTERQALALMNHPNIARVFDAGATDDGRPYFVMEYVEGTPLTEFCDEERLTTRQRLELFIRICDGVQHAHQKGIIHRDIKPTNVLVSAQDEEPVPKIIDFGIAKAIEKTETGSLLTQLGQVVGTLAYMSPEQAQLTGRDIDTRTDVYSLGVLLYELLVGALPIDATDRNAAFDEVCRRIREEDPPRPSTRFTGLGATSDAVSRSRRTDPGSYVRTLRGDLDWIVMKALEKEKARRYDSASELATDIRHFLSHEPVTARPPGALYRVGKFVRRHRVGVGLGVLLTLALIAGIVGTSVGLVGAIRAQREAREAQQLALAEAESAERLSDYLVSVFEVADPDEAVGNRITAREILDTKSAEIRQDLGENPGVRGRVMAAMGEAYMGLGLYPQAMPLLEESLPLLREGFGEDSERVYDSLNELGLLASRLDEYERARTYYEKALAIAERTHGEQNPHLPPILKNLGDVHIKLGNLETARALLERTLEIRVATKGPESRSVARTLRSLAALQLETGDVDSALVTAARSLAIREKILEPGDPGLGHGRVMLADVQVAAGRYDDARANLEAAIAIWEVSLGEDHDFVGLCLFRLARVQRRLGETDQAYESYRRSRSITERAFGADEPRMADILAESLDEYAQFLTELGRPEEARATIVEAGRLRERHSLR